MKKGDLDSKLEGFTIIEVALVLAIAGLIFLMVFVALPGLRASQRDAERREAVTMFLENVKKYQTNNRGALPGLSDSINPEDGDMISVTNGMSGDDTSWAGFYQKYLGENFIDPNGERYQLLVMGCGGQPEGSCNEKLTKLYALYDSLFPNGYTMYVVTQATCNGDRVVGTANPRKLAVLYRLESAGIYCANT